MRDLPVITITPPLRVRGGWVLDARVHYRGINEPVRITVTERLAEAILRASGPRASGASVEDFFQVAGIWDKIIATGKAIVSNPAVRMAVSMIPYGSTALTVADAGFTVADVVNTSVKAQQQVQKQPPHVQRSIVQHKAALQLARDLRRNKPAARVSFRVLPPKSKALVEQARLYDARTDAIRDYQAAKDGDQRAVDRMQRVKSMSTKNPFALAYTEALENAAISDQGPPVDYYARAEDMPEDMGAEVEGEVGAKVKRPRTPRRPVAHIIAELDDVVRASRRAA